jgi:hypothetical protein
LTLTGGPITTSGTLKLGGTLAIANGGTGATTAAGARTGLGATTAGSNLFTLTNPGAVTFLRVNADNTVTALSAAAFRAAIGAGTGDGTVTSASVTGTADITGSVATPTTTPALSLLLTTTGVSAGTYGSATEVPVFTVDTKGRISGVTNTPIAGGGSNDPEVVVFRYSSGGAGNFTPGDVIFSQTAGVTATVTDGANCIATYAFTGKSNPPKSIITYGQNFTLNTFNIRDTSSLPATSNVIVGGGTLQPGNTKLQFERFRKQLRSDAGQIINRVGETWGSVDCHDDI